MKKKILIVNDDGIAAPGLLTLVERLDSTGAYDLRIVAPEAEQSAVSHCLTIFTPLFAERTTLPGTLGHLPAFRIAGTPVDCVKLALGNLFPDRPNLIISGINRGSNFGRLLFYSGTVAAALEGAILGIPSIAMSLSTPQSRHDAWHFAAAAKTGCALLEKLLEHELPPEHFLAIEIPNIPEEEVQGVVLGRQGIGGFVDWYVEEEPAGPRRRFRVEGRIEHPPEPEDTDGGAIQANKISITPYTLDLTAHGFRETMRTWSIFR